MKIYDCFPFYNELDLLELRLSEHWDHVDHFVIAEANKTHQGYNKPFILEENWNRYKDFHEKIIHIKVNDMPTHPNAWVLENFQRNALAQGFQDANDDDIIVISDCDELLRGETFDFMKGDLVHSMWCGRNPLFLYKLNYMMVAPQSYFVNAVAARKRWNFSPQEMRNLSLQLSRLPIDYEDENMYTIQNAGWHFSYFGDTEHAANKLRNFAHQESVHWADKINVDEIISRKGGIDPNSGERFEYVEIDEFFPKTVLNNLEKWKKYILPYANAKCIRYKNKEK